MQTVIEKNGKLYLALINESVKAFTDLVEIPYILVKISEIEGMSRERFMLWARTCIGCPIVANPPIHIKGDGRVKITSTKDVTNFVIIDPVKFTIEYKSFVFNVNSADQALNIGYRVIELLDI